MISNVIKFIEKNINDYDEIHISYDMCKLLLHNNFIKKLSNDYEQNIIGDTLVGNILLNNKTINVYYNILYEFDDIEFTKKDNI